MPYALLSDRIEQIAKDWDDTAEICSLHGDRTGAAAFRTCANQLRRAVHLPEAAVYISEMPSENTKSSPPEKS